MLQSGKTKSRWAALIKKLVLLAGLYIVLVTCWPDFQSGIFFSTACLMLMLSMVLGGDGYGNQRVESLLTKVGDTLIISHGIGKVTIPIARIESIAIGKNYLGLIEQNNGNGYDITCTGSRDQIHHHIKNLLAEHFENCTVHSI
ncbi:hypothetical protein HUZ36_15320 [Pseudoalteromonas sp. McH1-7]|uniref:hypothetical protein n=1 Tax=Pseudoalteromonas sp. McH1-7 TaxID=2745574 RepID=UPI001591839F|nr:hypothetical protein [Pseudoalteromonas sp. McH1-7]NUZ12155.1 hypothetical protein [Pseudoalteromonas sp. McH1-7]